MLQNRSTHPWQLVHAGTTGTLDTWKVPKYFGMTIDVCTDSEGHGCDGTASLEQQIQLAAQERGAGRSAGCQDGFLFAHRPLLP